jgi:hypothetical protein
MNLIHYIKNKMYQGAGLAIIHYDNNNYSLLLAKCNKKYEWIFPGGKRNEDEEPVQTAYREFIEEVFNISIEKSVLNEIIETISKNNQCLPINTNISNINSITNIPSYTFIQNDKCITSIVNILSKYNIQSDVFNYNYENLYDYNKQVNIYNFCSMRRYINDEIIGVMNELVFITMVPLKNLLYATKNKDIFYYHSEYLKLNISAIFLTNLLPMLKV